MCRSLQRFTFVVFSLVFMFATLCSTTNAEDKPRLKIVMASPQGFLDDLEYLVVDLAEEKKQWDDNIYPSLDIFLIGVERTAPLRFDICSTMPVQMKSGYRYQPCIPVEAGRKGLKDFSSVTWTP
ncbi:MAG: hypothetical protein R3C02_05460 [Planctomycetaceae bacterium]